MMPIMMVASIKISFMKHLLPPLFAILLSSNLLNSLDHNFLRDLKTAKREREHFGSVAKSHCPQGYLALLQGCRDADSETLLLLCSALNPC